MFNKLKPKSDFSRNVLTLMTGTTIAQAIPIAISPILTRIYTPEDFGLFATYMSILMIFGSLVAGKYELAILIPKNDYDAKHIVFYSIILSFIISFILFILVLLFNEIIINLLKNDQLKIWLYLLPLNIFFVSTVSILYNWNNRKKKYKNVSHSLIIQSSTQGSTNLFIGNLSTLNAGLIIGTFMGNIASVIYVSNKIKKDFVDFGPKKSRVIILMKKYIKFPKYSMPSSLLVNMSIQMPIFFLSSFFGASIVGYYALSQRIIKVPISLIGSSFGMVFRQEASAHLYDNGNCRDIFISTLKKLFLISTVPFIIFYFISPQLFAFVFGNEWRVAGEYAQVLSILFYLQFLVNPLSVMITIAQKQQYSFYLHLFLIIGIIASFVIGYKYFNSVEISLKMFTFIYSLKYLLELIMSYKFTIR